VCHACVSSLCRRYDCHDVDLAHVAECRQLRRCPPADNDDHDGWIRPAALLDQLNACTKARCTSHIGTTTAVDFDCAYTLCSRRLLAVRRPGWAAATRQQTAGEGKSPQTAVVEPAKRAGFTDTAGACMAYYCGGQNPGSLDFLLCASRHRCAG